MGPATRPWLTRLAWLNVGLAVVVCFGVWPLSGGDLTMHLAVGRWIWDHGAVPRVDAFTFTTEGRAFIAHSWGAEVIYHGLASTAGVVGFVARGGKEDVVTRFALQGCAGVSLRQHIPDEADPPRHGAAQTPSSRRAGPQHPRWPAAVVCPPPYYLEVALVPPVGASQWGKAKVPLA